MAYHNCSTCGTKRASKSQAVQRKCKRNKKGKLVCTKRKSSSRKKK